MKTYFQTHLLYPICTLYACNHNTKAPVLYKLITFQCTSICVLETLFGLPNNPSSSKDSNPQSGGCPLYSQPEGDT